MLSSEEFKISEMLAKGSSSEIYRATRILDGKEVALKTLESTASIIAIDRFKREIEVSARLAHKNRLPVIASGRTQGRYWLATPYYANSITLEDWIASHKENGTTPSSRDVEAVALAILEAIGAIGRGGVSAHRDIKPSNILLVISESGSIANVFLFDFGVARTLDSDLTRDNDGPVGTIAYMPPEAFTKNSRDTPGVRFDLFSWGVTLYRTATGKFPYPGVRDEVSAIHEYLSSEYSPLQISELKSDVVSTTLEEVIMNTLRWNPKDRPKTPNSALQKIKNETPHSTTPGRSGHLVAKIKHKTGMIKEETFEAHYCGDLLLYLGSPDLPTFAAMDRYFEFMSRNLPVGANGSPKAVVFGSTAQLPATHRKRVSEFLNVMNMSTAVLTDSALVRHAVTAVSWLTGGKSKGYAILGYRKALNELRATEEQASWAEVKLRSWEHFIRMP